MFVNLFLCKYLIERIFQHFSTFPFKPYRVTIQSLNNRLVYFPPLSICCSQQIDHCFVSIHNPSYHFRDLTKMIIEYQKEARVILCTKVPEPAIFRRFLALQSCIINYISTFIAFSHVPLPYMLLNQMCFNNSCISSSEPQNQI